MRLVSLLLCLFLLLAPASASAQAQRHHGNRVIAFFFKRPGHWVAHHKIFFITTCALIGSGAALAQTTVDMQHRCPLCLGVNQSKPHSPAALFIGYGAANAALEGGLYLGTHGEFSKEGQIDGLILSTWGTTLESYFSWKNTQINNYAEFLRYQNVRISNSLPRIER